MDLPLDSPVLPRTRHARSTSPFLELSNFPIATGFGIHGLEAASLTLAADDQDTPPHTRQLDSVVIHLGCFLSRTPDL
jgi:hypothetical protein